MAGETNVQRGEGEKLEETRLKRRTAATIIIKVRNAMLALSFSLLRSPSHTRTHTHTN